ncbi:hypothetical protein CAK95_24520 [Pseudorhodoplanes sinuspersici]|uniref:Uncharacterized protein n=1 Tax=Pseudorhodoplanes sinuspersici TaxID=1235591 RepID=A0A1W6ZXA1_9HYPH|nr:hypothetical protein CAK95_24520 [Pseudorhodoplanes sinuspersici]
MLNGLLDKCEIVIVCPQCSEQLVKSIGWLRNQGQFACDCGAAFDTNQLAADIRKVEKSVEDFGTKVGKLRH